jgi:hypothetical protein
MTTYQPISENHTYPAAPWMLAGRAVISLQLMDVKKVRPLLPQELEIIPILPGKTIGGIYISTYGEGSVLNYSELIVFSSLTRYGDRIGAWITHIYVDNFQSIAGGTNIWGLPKQMARFNWTKGDRPQITVYQGEQLLCCLSYGWQSPGIPFSIPPFFNFSRLESELVWFSAHAKATSHLLLGTDLQIPSASPFADLELSYPWLGFSLDPLTLSVNAPSEK